MKKCTNFIQEYIETIDLALELASETAPQKKVKHISPIKTIPNLPDDTLAVNVATQYMRVFIVYEDKDDFYLLERLRKALNDTICESYISDIMLAKIPPFHIVIAPTTLNVSADINIDLKASRKEIWHQVTSFILERGEERLLSVKRRYTQN